MLSENSSHYLLIDILLERRYACEYQLVLVDIYLLPTLLNSWKSCTMLFMPLYMSPKSLALIPIILTLSALSVPVLTLPDPNIRRGVAGGVGGALADLGEDILGNLPDGGTKTGVHCGTTNDASLDDCKFLIQDEKNWNAAFAGNNNVCHYTNFITREFNYEAHNVACHGQCCVYVARMKTEVIKDYSSLIRQEASGLFGCADTSKGKINVMTQLDNKIGVCISNGDVWVSGLTRSEF
ncbi:hypothetical protein D9758_011738 [Tetrapyrgos nigripes]|uniref:Uncharacterized protein n=1 Tax=Tetrapyrgos nigripes TaxID=182062 RepID=A0A8H5GD75_9AGAR|nr:hypothetical protein D9758_011738 [Tetrapyrgos nigripes]